MSTEARRVESLTTRLHEAEQAREEREERLSVTEQQYVEQGRKLAQAEQRVAQQAEEIVRLREAVPTNWCDSIMQRHGKALTDPWNALDVEQLLKRIHDAMRAALSPAP